MSVPAPTADELLETIRRSNLPTLVVEGVQDVRALRHIEEATGLIGSILQCGGRTAALHIHDRIEDFLSIPIVFMLDRDLSVLRSVPRRSHRIVWTWGYSLENDLLSGSEIDKMFDEKDAILFNKILNSLVHWQAHAIFFSKKNKCGPTLKEPADAVVDCSTGVIRSHHVSAKFNHEIFGSIYKKIQKNPKRYIRGKQLLGAYQIILNRPGRAGRMNNRAIVDVCLTQGKNKKMRNIISRIRRKLLGC
jgi:hypothetical protein